MLITPFVHQSAIRRPAGTAPASTSRVAADRANHMSLSCPGACTVQGGWHLGRTEQVRVEVARVAADGSVRRTALDTADWDDAARWDELVAQADLNSFPPYRPVPHQTIYLIYACDREFAITEHDLTGPLRELVMAVLAEGEAP